jgi:predicted kinase
MQDIGSDVEKLRQVVQGAGERVANPVFIVVAGLPGAGKSYFSRRLAERLPSVIVESDALRKALWPEPTYSTRESQRLFSACHRLIEQLLRDGIGVILDATNLQERHRERLYRIADRLRVKLILVWVEAPAEVIRERLRERSRGADPQDHSGADWGVYWRMRDKAEKIGRGYFAVDTSRDVSPAIDRIVRQARR